MFDWSTPDFKEAMQVDGIQMVSESLEENALFLFDESQVPVVMKGVSEEFMLMTDMEKLVIDGTFKLQEDVVDYTTLGAGLAASLGARPGFINAIEIYAPKRDVRVNLANPSAAFNRGYVQIGGVFSLNSQQHDEQMAIVPIALARDLFHYTNESYIARYQVNT